MSTDADPLTDDDLEFLRRPLYGFLTVAAGPHRQPLRDGMTSAAIHSIDSRSSLRTSS
jgi:hypothetical protein